MENKDGINIRELLLRNGLIEYIGKNNGILDIGEFKFLKYKHLGPDIIGISKNNIYGFEHFKVDGSKRKKGSELMIEKKHNITNKITEITNNKEEININHKFSSRLSYENLKKNTFKDFENHYKKIKKYNENIINSFGNKKNIEIIFFIEYNILPSVYLINGKVKKYIYPFYDINFLNYFCTKKDISGLIFSTNNKNYYIERKNKYIVDNINIFGF